MFTDFDQVFAEVAARIVQGDHIVELEHWRRVRRNDGEVLEGTVVVRYTVQDGLIRWVELLH